jgi:hypothetical protein
MVSGITSFHRVNKVHVNVLRFLRHAHGLLGDIMGEGNAVIGHEPPDIVGLDAQAVDEIERLALFRFAALAGRRRARVGDVSVGQYFTA